MNRSDIGRLRKALKNDYDFSGKIIVGNYVKESPDTLISVQVMNFGLLDDEVRATYRDIFYKALGGILNKNMYVASCDNDVAETPMSLLRGKDVNENIAEEFLSSAEGVYTGNRGRYAVIALCGLLGKSEDDDFVLCAVCPVVKEKPKLVYDFKVGGVRDCLDEHTVKNPVCSILYPAFDEECPVISEALYYVNKENDIDDSFLFNMVHGTIPASHSKTKAWFSETMGRLDGGVTLEQVKSMQGEVAKKLEVPEEEQLVGEREMVKMMERSGFNKDATEEFAKCYSKEFGKGEIAVGNLMNPEGITISNSFYKVSVAENVKNYVSFAMVDGRKSIVLPLIENTVNVNGIPVSAGDLIED